MRALSLKQPWATAVMHGPVRELLVHGRTIPPDWGLPAWLALHASRDTDEAGWPRIRRLWPGHAAHPYPGGFLLGMVCIADVWRLRDPDGAQAGGRWRLEFGDSVPLASPILCTGPAGIWPLEPALASRLDPSQVDLYLRTLRRLVPEGGWIPPRARR